MPEETLTFGQWFSRKRRAHRPRLSQADIANRASRFVPISQTYISLIERAAGTPQEPDVSPDRIIALAHSLGENPTEALALRGNVVPRKEFPQDDELSLPGGGSIILRGRPIAGLSQADRDQLAAVVSALLYTF